MLNISLQDIVQMRKPHPCGGDRFEIIRVGADIKIKCLCCKRIIMMERAEFEKRVKRVCAKE